MKTELTCVIGQGWQAYASAPFIDTGFIFNRVEHPPLLPVALQLAPIQLLSSLANEDTVFKQGNVACARFAGCYRLPKQQQIPLLRSEIGVLNDQESS